MLSDFYWLFFSLYAAFAYGVTRLLYRSFMRTASAYALAILLAFMGFLWGLPTLLARPEVPTTLFPWMLLLAAGAIWAVIDIVALVSYKFTPVSVREPIVQTELIWASLLAFIILGEPITTLKVIGIACIFAGMLLVTLHPKFWKASFTSYGVRMTLLTAVLTSVAIIIDKKAVSFFSPEAYNPLGYLLPGLFLLLFIKGRTEETKRLFRLKWKWLLLASFLSASMYYSVLRAYQLADSSVVYPFIHMGSVIVIIGGMLVFREERVHVTRKVVAAALIVLGALFITGSTFF
jgi:bacterial/archaeal transporter family protein